MSLDASLKAASGLARHRNVLTKSERLARLAGLGKMKKDEAFILGMPKTSNRKLSIGKKSGKKTDDDAAATPAAGAKGAKAAAPAKAAAAPAKKK